MCKAGIKHPDSYITIATPEKSLSVKYMYGLYTKASEI